MASLKRNFLGNWQTTLTGVVLAVSTLLLALGVFTPEQATGVQTESVGIFQAIAEVIAGISAIVLMFKAKD